jgi:hypothetical protein
MIPHDATLILSELRKAGGECELTTLERRSAPRLTHGFPASWKFLLDRGLVRAQETKCGQLIVALAKECLEANPKYNNILSVRASEHEASKLNVAVDRRRVENLVKRTTDPRNFSPSYQAVVAGVKAKRDPLMEYVESLSPVDRPEFILAFMEMDDEAQENIRAGIARSFARGVRDRA